MIHTNRIVTVGEQECIIDRPIVLYRGDREVEVEFTLVGNEFMFSEEGNVIKSVNASHGQLVLNTPSGEHMFSELAECHEGKVVFVVTKEMIDEFIEMGFYSFQIRLYDSAEMKSRVTIPPVMNGFDIRNPIAAEDETNVVDQGIVDYARIFKDQSNEELPTFTWDGEYVKTEWVHHDVITENKMNKIEDALYSINANIKESDVVMLNALDNVKKDADKYVKEHMAEVEADVEEFERNLNTDVQKFKIDTNAAMTAHKNEVSEVIDGFDTQLEHIENLLEDTKINGIAFSVKEDFMGRLEEHINSIKEIGATGEMVVFASVLNETAVDVVSNSTDIMNRAFDYVNSNALTISLMKVHLVCNFNDGADSNRITISPNEGDEGTFFTNYENVLRFYLDYCNANNINRLCIANENTKLIRSKKHLPYWINLIANLKTQYPNIKLSYSMNSSDMDYFYILKENNIDNILNYLDFLSFNIYPKISNNSSFSVFETQKSYIETLYYTKIINILKKYHNLYEKDIIISEVGCTHTINSLNDPISSTGETNDEVQGIYYNTILNTISKADFIKGTYIWSVSEPFSFYNTTGELVLKEHFGGDK